MTGYRHISLTKCNSGATQKLPFGVETRIELKNITTSDNTVTLFHQNISHMPLSLDVVVVYLRSIVVLTPNDKCLGSSTIAFSERYKMPEEESLAQPGK